MNLRDWLYLNKVQNKTLAKDTGYSVPAVQLYLNHRSKIPVKFAKAVELYTQGEIVAEDLIKWSVDGIQERRLREAQFTSPKKAEEKLQKILGHICDKCNKKLTKAGLITKKES